MKWHWVCLQLRFEPRMLSCQVALSGSTLLYLLLFKFCLGITQCVMSLSHNSTTHCYWLFDTFLIPTQLLYAWALCIIVGSNDVAVVLGWMTIHVLWSILRLFHLTTQETAQTHPLMSNTIHLKWKFVFSISSCVAYHLTVTTVCRIVNLKISYIALSKLYWELFSDWRESTSNISWQTHLQSMYTVLYK